MGQSQERVDSFYIENDGKLIFVIRGKNRFIMFVLTNQQRTGESNLQTE